MGTRGAGLVYKPKDDNESSCVELLEEGMWKQKDC